MPIDTEFEWLSYLDGLTVQKTASATNGNWEDPATWTPNGVPATGDRVKIPSGKTVTITSQLATNIKSVLVKNGGTLKKAPGSNCRLQVQDLVGEVGSALDFRPDSTHTHELVFLGGNFDSNDYRRFGNGLVWAGSFLAEGKFRTRVVQMEEDFASGGATALNFASVITGWEQNDELLIPDTINYHGVDEAWSAWEFPTVSAIHGDSRGVDISTLSNAHPGGYDLDGVKQFDWHVGNLSSNLIFRSETPTGRRGHMLFAEGATGYLKNAKVFELGRTFPWFDTHDQFSFEIPGNGSAGSPHVNQIGRYAVHLHQLGTTTFVVEANAIFSHADSGQGWGNLFRWPIAVHGTHEATIKDNVVYNCGGAGIALEDSVEELNVIDGNYVVRCYGHGRRPVDESSSPGAQGSMGAGFYISHPNNYVRNNIAANCQGRHPYGYGLMLFQVAGHGDGRGLIPVKEWKNNTAYASQNGMTPWHVGVDVAGTGPDGARLDAPPSTYEDDKIWLVNHLGIFHYPGSNETFLRTRILNEEIRTGSQGTIGILFGDYPAVNTKVVDADIEGFNYGISLSVFDWSTDCGCKQVVRRGRFRNVWDITVPTQAKTGGGIQCRDRRVEIYDTTHLQAPGWTLWPVYLDYRPVNSSDGAIANYVARDDLYAINVNGNGEKLKFYFDEQRPNYSPVPETSGLTVGTCLPNLTNTQSLNQCGVVIGGEMVPAGAVGGFSYGISGLVAGWVTFLDINLSASTVQENQPVNTVVGTLSNTGGTVAPHTYTLVAGTGDTDNASFNINGNQLRTSEVFDFETKSSYSIRVRSTDAFGLELEKVFTVTVTDVLEEEQEMGLNTVEGRLVLVGGTSLRQDPYQGNRVLLWNPSTSKWDVRTIPAVGVTLSLSGLAANTNYDVYESWNGSALVLEAVVWTNATTPAAFVLQDGVEVLSGTPAKRRIGTIRTTTAGNSADSDSQRFVQNHYNAAEKKLLVTESTDSWSYGTQAFRPLNNNSNNKVALVNGKVGGKAKLKASVQASVEAGVFVSAGIGVNSTSVNSADACNNAGGAVNVANFAGAELVHEPALGLTEYTALELAYGGTATLYSLYSEGNGPIRRSGLVGAWEC